MPSMATSHGGILYYVVSVPKEEKIPPPVAASTPKQSPPTTLVTQPSTESGWDNPFRPDGDLSREADEIVELIKGGKPITPTSASPPPQSAPPPPTAPANGAIANGSGSPRTAEVKHATAQPPAQPEHVTIKKKPKSKCCSIQ